MCSLLPPPGFSLPVTPTMERFLVQASLFPPDPEGYEPGECYGLSLASRASSTKIYFCSPGYIGSNSTSLSNSCGHPGYPRLEKEISKETVRPSNYRDETHHEHQSGLCLFFFFFP